MFHVKRDDGTVRSALWPNPDSSDDPFEITYLPMGGRPASGTS